MRWISWLDSLPCRLLQHPNAMRVAAPDRIYLRCPDCAYESPGWDVAPAKPPQTATVTHEPRTARPVLRLRRRQG